MLIPAIFFALAAINIKAQTYNSKADGYNGGYGQVYQTFGLAQATINLQNNTNMQIQRAIMQQAMENRFGKEAVRQAPQSGSKTKSTAANNQTVSTKKYAFFTPIPQSDNLKIIADTVGQDDEQRVLFKQLFAETKKGLDAELAPRGRKNNLAAAMTFFIATMVTVYNDDPEPSEEAAENLFQALTLMYDEAPGMANVPNKDKQFLHDTFVSFSAMPLAFYTQAKETKDPEMLKLAKVIAGALLLEILKINPNEVRFEGNTLKFKNALPSNQTTQKESPSQPASYGIIKYTTNFDDGWVGTPQNEYVSLKRNGVEVRVFYANREWENSIPSTTQYDDFYWAKTVTPDFNVGNLAKWSDAGYFMEKSIQADAVDKKTGKRCFVTMWFVGQGGNRGVTVVVAPNRNDFQREFPSLKDISRMQGYNKFAVAAEDLVGTWTGNGGGGVEIRSAYDSSYITTNAISTSDEFVFASGGNYQSTHDSANMGGGSTRFAKLQYRGKFTASDWELIATNRVSGKTKKFWCQFEAVRGGFLLRLTDSDYEPLKYTLFKKF